MKNIYAAFVKAQRGFAPALKTSTNPHFKSKYVQLAGCIEAVVDALNAEGIALIQRTFEDSTGVTVETVFIHESGEMLECGKLHVPASKQDPQGFGSALTYARRYSLMAAAGIAGEDDDGNAGSRRTEVKTPDITDHLLAIEGSGSSEELAKIYKDALHACEGNQVLQTKVIQAKKARIERAKKEQS
jgi:hypothetical protein